MDTFEKDVIHRATPASDEAEAGLLSCILFNPRQLARVEDTVKPDYFLSDTYGLIYQAMQSLSAEKRAATLANVRDELSRMGELQGEKDRFLLNDLYDSVAALGSIEDYAASIIRTHAFRQGLKAAAALADDCYNQREGAFERAEAALSQIMLGVDNKPVARLSEAVDRYMTAYDERRKNAAAGIAPGIPTDFRGLDNLLGGLLPSRLYVLAARPSIGKTAIALNIALNIIMHTRSVLFFSAEMDEEEITQRLLSMDTRIDQAYLRDGQTDDGQDREIRERAKQLRSLDLRIDDRSYLLSQIRTKALQEHRKKKLDLIVVDYLQLLDIYAEGRGKNELRTEEVGKLSKGLKRLARDLKVPVLALAQLSRKSEESVLPDLSHLGESSRIEQDSDVVLFLQIDESEIERRNNSEPYRINVLIRKHRNGRIGQVPLLFKPRLTKFETIAPEYVHE